MPRSNKKSNVADVDDMADSDSDFQDMCQPSTSSGKGPPPSKKAKPLTAAERMRKYRAAQSNKKKQEVIK